MGKDNILTENSLCYNDKKKPNQKIPVRLQYRNNQ